MNNNLSPITNNLYCHLRVMLTQHANLGMGGTLSYAFQAGAIFGSVPDAFLWQASANQGYAYDPYRFTLLHGNQLLADKYLALQAEWNGQGILFNLIPGIRWLHLRELVEAKLAYGCLTSNSPQDGLTSNLYAELGVGIGNILRVCDLYSVWGFQPTTNNQSPITNNLSPLFAGKTTLLSGNSGVGKSTLLNALFGQQLTRTGKISDAHDKGMHTTTFSEMYFLADGAIIDTPGIKGFGSIDFQKEEVSHYFPEIFAVSRDCRFGNCTHTNEPGCAVQEAIIKGSIAISRYESYLSLLGDCDEGKYR